MTNDDSKPAAATSGADTTAADISYENAREELAAIVTKLESGTVPLADSLELWERGEKLAQICSDWLDGARARVAAAQAGSAGSDEPAAAPRG